MSNTLCPGCNGFGCLFDSLTGYVTCERCSPNIEICGFCGGATEDFEQGYHEDCARMLDEGAKIQIPKGVKFTGRDRP
jgi:hypothetical protein